VNFSTADHTDTHGYAPLFWRLYGIDTGGLARWVDTIPGRGP